MEQVEFVNWVIGVHGTVFTLSLMGLYRFSNPTQLASPFVDDADTLLGKMRRYVSGRLEEFLAPVFDTMVGPTIISGPVPIYSERAVSPVGTEAFRDAVRSFVESDFEFVVHYIETLKARNRWCRWCARLRWAILGLVIWELSSLATIGSVEKLIGVRLPDMLLKSSFAPSAILIVAFFVSYVILQVHHGVVDENKKRYSNL